MPILLLPKSNATPELIAHTVISKYADAIPLYQQSKIWNRVDIDLPRSTLCSWLINTAELCELLVAILHQEILINNYIQADESPIQVLKEPDAKIPANRIFGFIEVVAMLSLIINKRVAVIIRNNFYKILKVIYNQMLILAIILQKK